MTKPFSQDTQSFFKELDALSEQPSKSPDEILSAFTHLLGAASGYPAAQMAVIDKAIEMAPRLKTNDVFGSQTYFLEVVDPSLNDYLVRKVLGSAPTLLEQDNSLGRAMISHVINQAITCEPSIAQAITAGPVIAKVDAPLAAQLYGKLFDLDLTGGVPCLKDVVASAFQALPDISRDGDLGHDMLMKMGGGLLGNSPLQEYFGESCYEVMSAISPAAPRTCRAVIDGALSHRPEGKTVEDVVRRSLGLVEGMAEHDSRMLYPLFNRLAGADVGNKSLQAEIIATGASILPIAAANSGMGTSALLGCLLSYAQDNASQKEVLVNAGIDVLPLYVTQHKNTLREIVETLAVASQDNVVQQSAILNHAMDAIPWILENGDIHSPNYIHSIARIAKLDTPSNIATRNFALVAQPQGLNAMVVFSDTWEKSKVVSPDFEGSLGRLDQKLKDDRAFSASSKSPSINIIQEDLLESALIAFNYRKQLPTFRQMVNAKLANPSVA